MKYLIIGAGGTGGPLGFYLTKAGKDVTLIARGAHLKALNEHGLTMDRLWNGTTENIPVKAVDMEYYDEQPDVILVCVKGYSLDDTVPFIRKVMKKNTIVIPILNIYGTGGRLAEATAGDSCNRWLYLCGSSDQRARCIRTVRQGAEPCIWCAGSVRNPSGTGRDPGRSGILRYPNTSFPSYSESCTGEILLCVADRCGWLIL